MDEVWERTIKVDVMADLIKYIIINYNLIDIRPSKIATTWDNDKVSDGYVAKRLDIFLLYEHLVERLGSIQ